MSRVFARDENSHESRPAANDGRPPSVRTRSETRVDSVAEPRLTALDALRGVSMLLVVVAHAAIAYATVWIPRLLWAVHDDSRSIAFDAIFWASVSIAMPAFFTLSGFFAVKVESQHGVAAFVRDRFRRIFLPFLVGGATILPLCLGVWALGWLVTGRCSPSQVLRMQFADPVIDRNLFGPAHLWFLEYLLFMFVAFAAARTLRRKFSAPASSPRWLLHPLAPFALAIPTALILLADHYRLGVDAVADLRNSFLPDPLRWAHHGWFFFVGTWLFAHRREFDRLVPHWGWRLALCVPIFTVRLALLRYDLVNPVPWISVVGLEVTGALFGWLSLFGLLGLFQHTFRRPNVAVRYVADSSYWIYLMHFPVVGLLQVDLAVVSASSGAKFAIIMLVSTLMGLATYATMVRGTWVGRWLNGSRPALIPIPIESGRHRDLSESAARTRITRG